MNRLKYGTKSLHRSVVTCIIFSLTVTIISKVFPSAEESCLGDSCFYKNHLTDRKHINLSEEEVGHVSTEKDYFDLFEYGNNDYIHDFFKFLCKNIELTKSKIKYGRYFVYQNVIVAARSVKCYESVTYSTQSDYRYLDNLEILADKWNGPISVAIYAPGTDLEKAIERILYLRDCTNAKIVDWVTFHLFMDIKYLSEKNNATLDKIYNEDSVSEKFNCSNKPKFGRNLDTYRNKRLLYPVNIARNLARKSAQTHYVLSSDIELFPSVNFIFSFLKMLSQNQTLVTSSPKMVYVLPVFEIHYGNSIPEHKEELVDLINNKIVVPFHVYICSYCHRMPKYEEWILDDVKVALRIFDIVKRLQPFHQWEPIYVGTNNEPFYDERLSWEGLRDKMTQAYAMCLQDYDFAVLDNAFLVHREGIKRSPHNMNSQFIKKQQRLIKMTIKKQLTQQYGFNPACFIT